jgi:beta-xylosidase
LFSGSWADLSDWTWVNQGVATVANEAGGPEITAPALAGDNNRILVKAAPSTPYTVTANCVLTIVNANYCAAGLCFRQSSNGRLATIQWQTASFYAQKINNPTSYNSSYAVTATALTSNVWLRIADNGSNRIVSYSSNGVTWTQLYSVGNTDFLTADQVGFFANSNNASNAVKIMLLSWVIS